MRFPALETVALPCVLQDVVPGQQHPDGRRYLPLIVLRLPSGLALGLWKASGVEPAPTASGGGSELGFKVARAADVDATHAAWLTRGARIALPPTDLDFGRSFVALDPEQRAALSAAADRIGQRRAELTAQLDALNSFEDALLDACETTTITLETR